MFLLRKVSYMCSSDCAGKFKENLLKHDNYFSTLCFQIFGHFVFVAEKLKR